MSDAQSNDIKTDAHRMIDALPDDATWDDVMYRIYVRQCVDAGLKDSDANRVVVLSVIHGARLLPPEPPSDDPRPTV